ncbi:SUMO-specific isopeptidase USPL1-like isoform X2 [Xenia sp. Carnegie-2017]|nr:SUMO-specific isopeptidase USPL1-like isoform X2 [Xenia sp. Carnegie-2017]XP_046858282.1 SUMO-specific isopeptidase USPL1-like isoform X2 [Xenia sp. Carnegie-2017]
MCVYPFGFEPVEMLAVKDVQREWGSTNKGSMKLSSNKESEKEVIKTSKTTNTSFPVSKFYWSNFINLCWLDSVMTILVNNRCLQLCLEKFKPKGSILQELCAKFAKAQVLGPNEEGKTMLYNTRNKIFQTLQKKMNCQLGEKDSVLQCMNILLKDNPVVSERFCLEYEWTFKCSLCGYTQVDRLNKLVVSFPNTLEDFNVPRGVFLRNCYKCNTPCQRSQLDIKRLPPCVMVHFVEGVKKTDFFSSGFVYQGKCYNLCQFIQYKKNPDHFVAWIRHENGTHWMEVDDTQNIICNWKEGDPRVPLHEVHLAVWERNSLYRKKHSSGGQSAVGSSQSTEDIHDLPNDYTTNTSTENYVGPKHVDLSACNNWELEDVKQMQGKSNASSPGIISSPRDSNSNFAASKSHSKFFERSKSSDKCIKEDGKESLKNSSKRKTLFEAYVPKKKRNLSVEGDGKAALHDFSSFSWKGNDAAVGHEKRVEKIDSQIDSGYSSPGSNNSTTSNASQGCTKNETFMKEIIHTLDNVGMTMDNQTINHADKNLKNYSFEEGEAEKKVESLTSNFADIESFYNFEREFMDDIGTMDFLDFEPKIEEKTRVEQKNEAENEGSLVNSIPFGSSEVNENDIVEGVAVKCNVERRNEVADDVCVSKTFRENISESRSNVMDFCQLKQTMTTLIHGSDNTAARVFGENNSIGKEEMSETLDTELIEFNELDLEIQEIMNREAEKSYKRSNLLLGPCDNIINGLFPSTSLDVRL